MNEGLTGLLGCVRQTVEQAAGLAADVAYSVRKKAEYAAAVMQMRSRYAALEDEVNLALRDVGAMLYATHTGTPTESETLQAKLEEIDALKAEMETLRKKLADRGCHVCCCGEQDGGCCCRECGGKQ